MIDVTTVEYLQRARLQDLDAEAEKALQAKAARNGEHFASVLLPVAVVAPRARHPLSGNSLMNAVCHN